MKYVIIIGYFLIALALKTNWGKADITELPKILWKHSGQWIWALLWPLYALIRLVSMIGMYLMFHQR